MRGTLKENVINKEKKLEEEGYEKDLTL